MKAWRSAALGLVLMIGGSAGAQDRPRLAPPLSPPIMPAAPIAPPVSETGAPASAPARQHDLNKTDVDAWLDGYMPYALRTADIPGAVVTVVKDGQILTARGFGYSNVEKRTPVDPDTTLFRPGSVSKLVTWTAVMQLVEQGKLDLDKDVNAYLDFKIPPYQGKPVTLRQIMTHTAGFEEAVKELLTLDPKMNAPLDAYLKRWTPVRIFAPGTTPAYSNWATALAGYIVQRTSGESFDTYVERHIFAPLGMKNSSFRQPLPANLVAQLATAYPKPGEAGGFEYVLPAPAGSLSSSGTDMARFMIAHLQGGAYNGNRILKPGTAEMMHNSPLGPVNPMSLLPPLNRMELGFFETNINGREVVGHLGDTSAFHTSLHLFLKENVGFYVSFNSPGKAAAVQALRTAMFQDFSDRYFPNIAPPDGRVDAKIAAEHARMMAGNWMVSRRSDTSFLAAVYWLAGQTKIAVGPKGELVIPSLTSPGGRPRQWVEIAPFVWRDVAGHDRMAAKVIDGKVVRWSFDLAAPFEVFDRVPAGKSTTWILPALFLSLAILLLTFLSWPIGWFARRRYAAPAPLAGTGLRAQRATRLMAGLAVGLLLAWAVTIGSALSHAEALSRGLDPLLWLLQIGGAIIFVGTLLIGAWNLAIVWRGGRRWTHKVWSVLIVLSALMILYVAIRFGLLAMTVHY